MGVAASGPHDHPAPVRVQSPAGRVPPRPAGVPSGCPGVRGLRDGSAAEARGSAPSPTPALLDGARSATTPQSGAAIKSAQGETRSPLGDVDSRRRVIQAS